MTKPLKAEFCVHQNWFDLPGTRLSFFSNQNSTFSQLQANPQKIKWTNDICADIKTHLQVNRHGLLSRGRQRRNTFRRQNDKTFQNVVVFLLSYIKNFYLQPRNLMEFHRFVIHQAFFVISIETRLRNVDSVPHLNIESWWSQSSLTFVYRPSSSTNFYTSHASNKIPNSHTKMEQWMYTEHFIWGHSARSGGCFFFVYHITIIGFPSSNNN